MSEGHHNLSKLLSFLILPTLRTSWDDPSYGLESDDCAYQEVEMVLKSENADVVVVELAFVMSQCRRTPSWNNSPCLHAISSHKVWTCSRSDVLILSPLKTRQETAGIKSKVAAAGCPISSEPPYGQGCVHEEQFHNSSKTKTLQWPLNSEPAAQIPQLLRWRIQSTPRQCNCLYNECDHHHHNTRSAWNCHNIYQFAIGKLGSQSVKESSLQQPAAKKHFEIP